MRANVFLTDDSIETIEVLSAMYNQHPSFQAIGYGRNSLETLQALRTLNIDILSIDIELGQESGIDLCKQIHSEFPNVLLVMCSVESGTVNRVNAVQAGASYFLSKPFGLRELNALLLEYQQFKKTGRSSSLKVVEDDVSLVNSFLSLLDLD